jgi:hypothetical protein
MMSSDTNQSLENIKTKKCYLCPQWTDAVHKKMLFMPAVNRRCTPETFSSVLLNYYKHTSQSKPDTDNILLWNNNIYGFYLKYRC